MCADGLLQAVGKNLAIGAKILWKIMHLQAHSENYEFSSRTIHCVLESISYSV